MFQTKVVEKIKTHILCSVTFFSQNRAVYEIMWENIVERDGPQMTIWHMRIACEIPKATRLYLGARCWWRSWLRHCATSRKVAGSISDGVIDIFH